MLRNVAIDHSIQYKSNIQEGTVKLYLLISRI